VLRRETERQRAERLVKTPYDTPLFRSADINKARQRVNAELGTILQPISRYGWEICPPHDCDPLWPLCLQRAADEMLFTHNAFDRVLVEDRAARILHDVGNAASLSTHGNPL